MGSGRGLGRNGGPMMHRQGGSAAPPPVAATAAGAGPAVNTEVARLTRP